MLLTFVMVLVSIAIGETLTSALQIPIPGSIPGLLVAVAYFAWRGGPTEHMSRMFDVLIPFVPMLFVPAGAGLVAHIDLIAADWIAIISAVTLAATGGLLVTGATAQFLLKRFSRSEGEL